VANMHSKEPTKAQVHRFGDRVAIYIDGGSTRYLTPEEARAIAGAMVACADSIENDPDFSLSTFATWRLNTDM
jgi:hypothetical protein